MALKETIKQLKDLISQISKDIEKADGGNKAASQRVRTATVRLEKTAKIYRKESIKNEKSNKGTKKTTSAKKPAAKKPMAKTPAKTTAKSPVKNMTKAPAKTTLVKSKTLKAKPKAKSHKAKARPLSFKKPSAKLLTKRAYR